MSFEDDDIYDDISKDAAEAAGEEAGITPDETVIIKNTPKPVKDNLENHPKIRKILENPDVDEVHIKYKMKGDKRIQPYVCIVFLNGSIIERPLADIDAGERLTCAPSSTNIITSDSRLGRFGRWFGRGNHMQSSGDTRRIVEESRTRDGNCTIIRRKSMIVVCDPENDDDDTRSTGWRNSRRRRNYHSRDRYAC